MGGGRPVHKQARAKGEGDTPSVTGVVTASALLRGEAATECQT